MSDVAPVLVGTAALLGVAVLAGAAGAVFATLRAGLEALRAEHARTRADVDAIRAEQTRVAAQVTAVRGVVRQLDREAVDLLDEADAPPPIGFRPP